MRKKNDRVILPLAIPKSCDFFFFFGQINVGCQATHTPKKGEREKKRKREESIVMF